MINDTELIDGKLKVLRILGQGGGGTVYVCWHDTMQKEVAVKVLSEPCPDPVSLKRFKKEAQAISVCDHPGIVKLHSFGMCANGKPYYVMDLVNGKSLSSIIAERGKLSPPEFETIFLQVAGALEHAHSNGLVHRDIKPSNIMVDTTGGAPKVFLIDFGLSRSLNSTKLTVADSLLGTPAYMSPEQCTGAFVDHRSDIYSLGCTMYEAATGEQPFTGEAYEILMAHVNQRPQNIPTRLAPLLDRCLAIAPEQRFSNVKEVIQSLQDLHLSAEKDFWLPGAKSQHVPVPKKPAHAGRNQAWRQRLPIIFGATAAIMIVVGLWCFNKQKEAEKVDSGTPAPPVVPVPNPPSKAVQDAFGNDAYTIQIALNEFNYTKALKLADAVIQRAVQAHLEPDQIASLMIFRLQAMIGLQFKLPEIVTYAETIKHLKPGPLNEAQMEFLLANHYNDVGKIGEAERSYEQSLELLSSITPASADFRGDVYPTYLIFLRSNNRSIDRQEEVFHAALDYFERLSEQSDAVPYIKERWLWDAIIPLEIKHPNRELLTRMSDYLKVEAQSSSVPWYSKLDGLTYRANAECLLGHRKLARSLYDQAIQIGEQNELKYPKPNTAFVIHNIMGFLNPPFSEKIALALRTAELCSHYEEDGNADPYVSCADHVAKIYLDNNQLSKAAEWYSKAAEVAEKYARSRYASHNVPAALSLFERTLSMLNNSAAVAAQQKNKAASEQFIQRGEKLLAELKSNPSLYSAARDRAYRAEYERLRASLR